MGELGHLFQLVFSFPILNVLMLLYQLFGDFGLSIVVLTLIIKLALFPLTLQQLKSMKANQALQPQMQEIRKKYKDDQQAQMQATQALYKEYGVNPLAGCLPLFIQLPILYGLYNALVTGINQTSVESLNALLYPFVPHFTTFPNLYLNWFTWLSFLNPILHVDWTWTFSLAKPDPTHVLPILAGLATFIQLRMSQPKTTPTANGKPAAPDPTAQSMKMMQYIMPFFTIFIGWTFASGLALYWTVSSVFQAVQQYFVTGWGSLLTTPNLKKALESVGGSSDSPKVAEASASSGAVATQMQSASKSGENGNQSSRRAPQQRGNSASARRRNGQKSRR